MNIVVDKIQLYAGNSEYISELPMQKTDIADNPQERRLIELGWLTGMIDGEGCVNINFCKNYSHNSHHFVLVPRIQVSNNDYNTILAIKQILKRYDIGCHINERKPKQNNHGICYILSVSGAKRCYKLLKLIQPFSVTKQERINLLLNWIDYRLKVGKTTRYGEKEYSFYLAFSKSMGRILNDYTLNRLWETCFGTDYRIYNKRWSKQNSDG